MKESKAVSIPRNVIHQDETGQVMTTSIQIAEHFGIRHADLLRMVRNLKASSEFVERNFALYSYRASNGKEQRAYNVTKDGLMMLAGKINKPKAAALLEAYIAAFNFMLERGTLAPTLQSRVNEYTARERLSVESAQDASRVMNQRKKQKPALEAEGRQIMDELQCSFRGAGFDVAVAIKRSEPGQQLKKVPSDKRQRRELPIKAAA